MTRRPAPVGTEGLLTVCNGKCLTVVALRKQDSQGPFPMGVGNAVDIPSVECSFSCQGPWGKYGIFVYEHTYIHAHTS